MSDFVLSCCSTVDLTQEVLKKRDISFVCFHYELDGVQYMDDMGVSMSPEKLFEEMAKGKDTKTSQVAVGEYMDYFIPFLEAGKDILHVTLSSGISGTYGSACLAKTELEEKYPDRKIYIVDSLAASSGYGLLMEELADLRDAGKTIEEVYEWVEEHKLEIRHWFFSTDLSFYIRGGRISKTAGFIGGMLNICPLLDVAVNGTLQNREKVRTKRKVINRIVEKMEETVENGKDYDGRCYLCNSVCYDDARAVADLVEERFPKLKGKVQIFSIGTTIGSHTGPGTIALFYKGAKRTDY